VTSPKEVTSLTDMDFDEVSFVDRGANQHARMVLSKRDDRDEEHDEEHEETSKADPDASSADTTGPLEVEDEEGDEEPEEETSKGFFTTLVDKMFGGQVSESTTGHDDAGNLTSMDDVEKAGFNPGGPQLPYGMQPQGQPAPGPQNVMGGAQAFPAAQQMPGQVPGQMPGQDPVAGQMQAGPPLPDEVVQYIKQLEEAVAAANGDLNKPSGQHQEENVSTQSNPFGKSAGDLDEGDLSFLSELSKNLEGEEQREAINKAMERITAAEARANEADEIAKAEREHRLNGEYLAKAQTYRSLPVSAEEFGPVLKKLDEVLDEDERGVLEKALRSADDQVASATLFSEVGKRGGGEGYQAISKLDASAQEIRKENPDISMESARERALEADPSLYDEFLSEQGR